MSARVDIFNIILGMLSVLALISGFFVEKYNLLFWIVGGNLLALVVISYYIFDNRERILFLHNKFNKIAESLNIYNRLNKLELAIQNEKRTD